MLFENFLIDPRSVIKPFEKGSGREFDQVLKPNRIHGQQRQVITGFLDA